MTDFFPQNDLETELQAAMADRSKFGEFLKTLVRSSIYVPSVTDIEKNPADFRPVLLDKNGKPHMVVFTSKERASAVAHVGAYGSFILGARLIRGIPPGSGLYVNPGVSAGFDMSPEGVAKLASGFF